MITLENYEEYVIMHLDGELTPAAEQALMQFLDAHPELKSELAVYDRVKLTPDASVVYADKASLMKSDPGKRTIPLFHWQRYAIAAGIAALLCITFFKFHNSGSGIVVTDKPYVAPALVITKPANIAPSKPSPLPSDTIARKAMPLVSIAPKSVAPPHTIIGKSPALRLDTLARDNVAATPTVAPPIPQPQVIAPVVIPQSLPATADTIAQTIPAPKPIDIADHEPQKSLLDKLPIDDLKKREMQNVALALADGYDRINAIKQQITEASISIKVEKRKLIISF